MNNLSLINISTKVKEDKKLIFKGLSNKKQKQLLPKFFYDERGSKLFNKITNLKEYYQFLRSVCRICHRKCLGKNNNQLL